MTVARKKNQTVLIKPTQTSEPARELTACPEGKRKAYKLTILWDLRTYRQMKKEIEDYCREVDNEASLSATDIRDNIYLQSKDLKSSSGFNTSVIIGHPIHHSNDPTPEKAESLSKFRMRLMAGLEFKEIYRRVQAIDSVYESFNSSMRLDNKLKAKLMFMKYFQTGYSDEMILTELHISRATFFRWESSIVKAIARNLGFII